ncbi:hypothetical protein BD413DRAFT_576149 [Trametes elegans]|nr:hypothetical protein BD413DRAFT_576149 [Trametes elegans]
MHSFFQQEAGQDGSDFFGNAPQGPQQQQQQPPPMQYQQHLGGMQQQVNMDVLENLLSIPDGASQQMSSQPQLPQMSPQALLEQQMRLNQLQQLVLLQNQIVQQLSGQASFSLPPMLERPRDTQQYGLPTPASSTELRAQQIPDFVSPMLLHSGGGPMGTMVQNPPPMLPNFIPQQAPPTAPHSAPANIVFSTSAIPLSPGDIDFHIPSPFLGPHNPGNATQGAATSSQGASDSRGAASSGKRRNTSSSGDESTATSKHARKRQSPGIRPPSNGPSSSRRGSLRGTRSANSTPLFPATMTAMRPSPVQRSFQGTSDIPGDTPSPVDPPMPPPAHPASGGPSGAHSNSSTTSSPPLPPTPASPAMPAPTSQITPVTPASMLKLGRLAVNSSLAAQLSGHEDGAAPKLKEGRMTTRSGTSKGKSTEKAGSVALTSPALKPIRPAGNAVITPTAASPSAPFTQPMHVRKTSHKAAEQKRRDSLKTSFDDLRILLPPIPLPSEEGFPDEPLLPGAMPPRGPPKGNAEGPNRGVSKLQLLRCGNEFIKVLKGRVERRDEEIAKLRGEVRRLRDIVGEEAAAPPEGQEMLDLERDLDACEISAAPAFGRARGSSITENDGDDDGDY